MGELRHKNFGTRILRTELGAEFNNWRRSPQLGAEVTSVPKLLVPNIDSPLLDRPLLDSTLKTFFFKNSEMDFSSNIKDDDGSDLSPLQVR